MTELTSTQTCFVLGRSLEGLKKLRAFDDFPRARIAGNSLFYPAAALRAWIVAHHLTYAPQSNGKKLDLALFDERLASLELK